MDEVIRILNKDEKAKMLHSRFNELCKLNNIVGADFDKAKEAFLMMMIAGNEEAMQAMATETYTRIS
jgi:hypothetical protein